MNRFDKMTYKLKICIKLFWFILISYKYVFIDFIFKEIS